ncbi:phage major capsid protein [Saccharospirillum sp.]|uniref:phage major capsid protein n=1 Tax=Saccharospirillum sp. TaxID=2033801 RepID=UPI0034A04924
MSKMKELTPEQSIAARRYCEANSLEFVSAQGVPTREEWSELHAQKKTCHHNATAILDAADAESRDLNENEATAFEYFSGLAHNLNREMDKRVEAGDKGPRNPALHGREYTNSAAGVRDFASQPSRKSNMQLISPESGKALPVYGHGEPMAADDGGEFTIGQIGCAIARGDFNGMSPSLRAAVSGSGDGGGAYMLAPEQSGRVIDLARSASVAMRAGAQTVPMNTSEMTLLRVLSDPTVTARRELQAVNASKPTFGQFTLQSKMYSAIVPITIEQLEDAANAPSIIESVMRSALGLALDQAILAGAGGAEVLGITNAEGTNEQTGVGTPIGWGDVSQAVGSIMGANYTNDPEGLSWIMNPRDGGTYDRLVAGDNQPLRPSPWAGALNRLPTTSLEPVGGETNMIIGDFSQVLVGMRTGGVVFDVVDSGSISDGENTINAASQFVRFLRARVRFDAVMMRPDWLTVLRGVTA